LDGSCDYLGPQWATYTGVPLAKLLAAGWWEVVHPEDRESVSAGWRAARESLEPFDIEFRVRGANGDYRWFKGSVVPMFDEAGRAREWCGVGSAIEEQRQAAERLRLSEERFRSLVMATTSVIWSVDHEGRMSGVQPSWSAYTGQDERRYQGFGWVDAIAPRNREAVLQAWERCRTEGTIWQAEGQLWHANSGGYRRFEVRGVPVVNGDGSIREWIGKFMDVEEERQAEQRIYRLLTEAKEESRKKDEFLSTLSHELRGPLAPIRNSTLILQHADLDEPFIEARDVIGRQVVTMTRLVDDLLDLSRIETSALELRREPVELAAVLRLAVEMVDPLLAEAGHDLRMRLPAHPIRLEGDPARLAQVFSNLLTNACKFTDDGGRIDLEASGHDEVVELRVRDYGVGIAPEHLPRLFERFFHATSSTHRSQSGLGIGLSLVKALVERHGGTITAHSAGVGMGSEFVVTLPVAPTSSAAEGGLAPTDVTPPVGKAMPRVLVVDDNVDSAVTLATLLKLNRFDVNVAYDGASALDAASDWRPDVVLLDLGMPGMDGYQVCRRLRQRNPEGHLLVFALTGWGQPHDTQRTKAAGFDHHLTKPVDLARLFQLLPP
jgi:PAS domain S-box-containing protein